MRTRDFDTDLLERSGRGSRRPGRRQAALRGAAFAVCDAEARADRAIIGAGRVA